MRRYGVKNVDPHELDTHYSTEQGILYEEIQSSEVTFESFKPYLDLLPPREVDLIEMYYYLKKNQKDIAKMFGVTQGAVSSRLSRATQRLKFMRNLPKIADENIERDLGGIFDPLEIEIIKCMKATTCQSKTAQMINDKFKLKDEKNRMTQVKVRHRFLKCLNKLDSLKEGNTEIRIYHDLLHYIKKNLYKMHEVNLPHFDRGQLAVFSISS